MHGPRAMQGPGAMWGPGATGRPGGLSGPSGPAGLGGPAVPDSQAAWAPAWATGLRDGPVTGAAVMPAAPVTLDPAPAIALDRRPLTLDRTPLTVDRATMVIDVGVTAATALVVTERGSWLVPDPASGEGRWPGALHWDGQWMVVGAAAVQRGQVDPGGYRGGLRRALIDDDFVVLGSRLLGPVEAVAEFLGAVRGAAGHLLASLGGSATPPDHAVVLTPPGATDTLRRRLVGATEAAGFTAVELLPAAAAAVWAPGLPVRTGELALVLVVECPGLDGPGPEVPAYGPPGPEPSRYDAVAAVDATLVRVGEGLPEILGHTSTHPSSWVGDHRAESGGIDPALADCRDLLARLGVGRTQVNWVVVVGGGARTPGLVTRIEQGLGIAVATVDEPELAVIRGAAAWLPRSGPRRLPARNPTQRLVPLAYTLPGHRARLLRWLVEARQPYAAGATVARVRSASGAVWDLTVRTPGVLEEVLVPAGREVRSGEWLALVRPA
jgi:molecular chaperone DnaK